MTVSLKEFLKKIKNYKPFVIHKWIMLHANEMNTQIGESTFIVDSNEVFILELIVNQQLVYFPA